MKQLQNEFNYKKVGPTSLFCTKRPLAGNLYCSPMPHSQLEKPLTCCKRLSAHIACCGVGDGVGWGVCENLFFLLWHKDIFATLWGDILLHLHTNMMSRYHIFSWRYHDHDNDEK